MQDLISSVLPYAREAQKSVLRKFMTDRIKLHVERVVALLIVVGG